MFEHKLNLTDPTHKQVDVRKITAKYLLKPEIHFEEHGHALSLVKKQT